MYYVNLNRRFLWETAGVTPSPVPGPGKEIGAVRKLAMRTTQSSLRRSARILGRAVLRRCPHCGGTDVFRNYLRQKDSCPGCGLRLDRGEPDFFIGAYTVNLIVAEVLVVGAAVVTAVVRWPDVPWTGLMYGLAALMVVAPIGLYPLSRQLWLAVDLIFQPPDQAPDFSSGPAGHGPTPPPSGPGNRID